MRSALVWARRPIEALERTHVHFAHAPVRPRLASSAAWVGLVLAIVGVIALTLQHLRLERDLALSAGAREVDMRATLLAHRLSAALAAEPQAPEAEIFRRVLKAHPDQRLAQSILVDRNGRLIELDDAQSASGTPLAGLVGGPWPSAPGGEQGGVVRVQTQEGGDQFAAVRALSTTSARVAFASPVDLHLAAWRRTALVTVFLLASTVALLAGAGGLYAIDVRRKLRRVREDRARRARVDLALNRGRCGLWTWDLERGRIQWSASMFALLELDERPGLWTIADLQALVHPEDESMEAIARAAAQR